MLLLAADTSGKNGSIALARGNPDGACDVLEVVPLQGGTFSAELIPQVIAILKAHHLKKEDLGGFAVVSGPGSFTGLRVGLAAIKAMAEVLHKPIAAVSLLEAIAVEGTAQGNVVAILDAGRNEAYLGRYRVSSSGADMIEEKLVKQSEIDAQPGEAVATTVPQIADTFMDKKYRVDYIANPHRAGVIAVIGWRKILAGETTSPETLDANYIRRSDAEIFSQNRS
jgi:tRNA threonylcarbamoyladenosine biosynthesis protein TsaB